MSTDTDSKPTSRFTTVEKSADADVGYDWLIPEGPGKPTKWDDTETIKPLMDPERLVEIYRKSAEVPKNARTRAKNIAGFGWSLEPVIRFDDPGLPEKARMYMYLDRIAQWRRDIGGLAKEISESSSEKKKLAMDQLKTLTGNPPTGPTNAEVETEIASWKQRAEMEEALLTIRLETFCYEYPLQELITLTEINRGGLAFAGWEILRDPVGTPIRAKLIEPMHVRATREDKMPIPVPWLRKTSKVTYEEIHVERRFRRWYMQRGHEKLWYKEFGYPKVVSQQTGRVYEDSEAFEAAKEAQDNEATDAREATEFLLWAEYSPGAGPYGMPIWHGHSLDVETSRLSKEFDYDELKSGKTPRGLFSIVDAEMEGSGVVEGFKRWIREGSEIGGNRNRVGVLELVTKSMLGIAGAGRAALDFISFRDAQQDDATHMQLKKMSDSGVSQDFGNPRVNLGASEDIQNRAVAEMSQEVAEEQTYTPIRNLWNHCINQYLIRPWGFRFWTFKLNGPRLQQTEAVGKLIDVLVEKNILTPDQCIPIAAQLLGIEILGEPADWQKVPPKAVQAGMTKDLLAKPDDPMTVEDESKEGRPGETESIGEAGSEEAVGLLQQLGMLATGFTDGVAEKVRKGLGLDVDFWPAVDDDE